MIGHVRAEATVAQFVHLIGEGGDQRVVGGEQERHVALAAEAAQQLEHLTSAMGVEVPGRLVGENQLGIGGQRKRDQHALALAHRQLLGAVV